VLFAVTPFPPVIQMTLRILQYSLTFAPVSWTEGSLLTLRDKRVIW
jgi:hypothetical protein